jgi:hypothetical protein
MAQPDFSLMARGAETISRQLELCGNLPAIDGGAAILTRLDHFIIQVTGVSTQLTGLTNQLTGVSNQITNEMTNLRNEITNEITNLRNEITDQRNQITNQITNQTNQMTNQITALTNQVAAQREEMRAKSVSPKLRIQYLLTSLFRDKNINARLRNSSISDRTLPLAPLVNPRTGAVIPGFPMTSAALSRLNCIYIFLSSQLSILTT